MKRIFHDMATDHIYHKIITDENLMEDIPHGTDSYPFRYYDETMAQFDFNCIDWHWHTELEFVYVQSGIVTVWVGEQQIDLSAGDGIFINSKMLHRFYSASDAHIPNFLCMPTFIAAADTLLYHKYVLPVMTGNLPFLAFHQDIPWQAQVLTLMQQIFTAQNPAHSCELLTSSLLQQLWLLLFNNVPVTTRTHHQTQSSIAQARLQIMMQYIHQNYSQNLSLEDIASQSAISKSSALNLFHKYLHITPVNYLINYRLKQATLLLLKTEKKIHAIATETGFNHVDYFCRLFKNYYHMTPTEYRIHKRTQMP